MEIDYKKLALPFLGMERVTRNFSGAAQDIFVLSCLNGKENGVWLDLGCQGPTVNSNTNILEIQFGWHGVSVDIDEQAIKDFKLIRKTCCLNEDATKLDFDKIVGLLGTNRVDYLSMDMEPPDITLKSLEIIPFDKFEFSLITYEHDRYRSTDQIRDESRKIIENAGYKMLCRDVGGPTFSSEDWYYNSKYVDYERIKVLEKHNIPGETLVMK